MPGLIVKNNAKALLQNPIIVGATSATMQAGHTLAAIASGSFEYGFGTYISSSNTLEVVKITNITGNVVTHSATVNAWSAGDRFEMRPCKELLDALRQEAPRGFIAAAPATGTDTYAATLSPVPLAYITGMVYGAVIANANLLTTSTINFNGMGAKNIKKEGAASIAAGDMPIGHFALWGYDGTNMVLLNPKNQVLSAPFRNYFIDGQIQASKVGPVANLSTAAQYGASLMIAGWASGGAISAGTLTIDTASTIGSVGRAVQFSGFTTTGSGVLSARARFHSSYAAQLKNKTVSLLVTALQDTGGPVNANFVVRKPTAKDNYAGVTVIGTSGATSVPNATSTPVPYNSLALGDCSFGLEIEVQVAVGAVATKNLRLSDFVLDLEAAVSNWAQESKQDADRAVAFYYASTFPAGVSPAQNPGTGLSGAINLASNSVASAYSWIFPQDMASGAGTVTTYNPSAVNANWRDVTNAADRAVVVNEISTNQIALNAAASANARYAIHATYDCRL